MFNPNDPVDNITGEKVIVDGVRMDVGMPLKPLLAVLGKLYARSRALALLLDAVYVATADPRAAKRRSFAGVDFATREDVVATRSALRDLADWTASRSIPLVVMTSADSEFTPMLRAELGRLYIPYLEASKAFAAAELTPEQVGLGWDPHMSAVGTAMSAWPWPSIWWCPICRIKRGPTDRDRLPNVSLQRVSPKPSFRTNAGYMRALAASCTPAQSTGRGFIRWKRK